MHFCDSKSRGGTHHVGPEVAAELGALSMSSFICTILVFTNNSCDPQIYLSSPKVCDMCMETWYRGAGQDLSGAWITIGG
jgi:hypothetical protein